MSQQRMAGSQGFQSGMKKAAGGPQLMGAGAWDRQVERESAQKDNAAVQGSTGAANLADYINVSKSATQANGNFSINNANKYVDNSREQSKINKKDNEGFSDKRREENVNFANKQMDNNMERNEGFAMGTTNNFINNAKEHREENTELATAFADRTVDKYIQKNKDTQAINVGKLDQQVRSAPIVDNSYSTLQGKKTFGDMYSYSRKELPSFKLPTPQGPSNTADIRGIYDSARKDIKDTKL